MTGGSQQANLVLEARASQDTYGSGPQSFPYVSFFPEYFYGSGGGAVTKPDRWTMVKNLGVKDSKAGDPVEIRGGTVYCGVTPVSVEPATFPSGSQVYLNITVERPGSFSAEYGLWASGDLSILCYNVKYGYVENEVSNTMFIPYYN